MTQVWLVESSTIIPKLYSEGVPLETMRKKKKKKKMAESRFRNFNGFIFPK